MIARSVFRLNTRPEDGPPDSLLLVGTICQGLDTGKACIWDSGQSYVNGGVGPNQTLSFGEGNYSNNPITGGTMGTTVTTFAGGANLREADQCTNCHMGENIFFGNPLSQLAVTRNYPIPSKKTDAIVPVGWLDNPPLVEPGVGCGGCHTAPDQNPASGGRFPQVSTETSVYCDKLQQIYLDETLGPTDAVRPTIMPIAANAIGEEFFVDISTLSQSKKEEDWPDYYSMLQACATPPPPESNPGSKMMSMDGPAPLMWVPDEGTVSDVTGQSTEGTGSMSVNASGYVRLDSRPANSWVFAHVGSEIAIDVYVPPGGQPNPAWLGSLDLFLSIPSAEMFNTYVGHAELTPSGTGWRTVSFALSAQAQTAQAGTHPDVRWGLATNTQGGAPALLLDNMRFAGTSLPGGIPPQSPTRYNFERGNIWPEFDGDVVLTQTSGEVEYSGSSSLEVMFDGSSDGRVWIEPQLAIQPGSTITYRVFVPDGAPVVAIQPYVADNNWVWDETWNANFPQGARLTVTTTLSPQAALPVRELGLKFYLDDNYTGPIYIDAVTW